MKLIVCVCFIYGISLGICRAAIIEGTTESGMAAHQKFLRAAGDGNQANNMNVGFVPLISIIANLLPRFFTRYATVPPATVQQARSMTVQTIEPVVCQNLDNVGLMWSDHLSPSAFYQCHFSKYCFNSQQKPCFQVRRHHCKQSKIFHAGSQKCIKPFFTRDSYKT